MTRDEKIEKLISLLGSKGFEGIDASIEESLLGYSIVRRELDGRTIICFTNESGLYSFGITTIQINDIRDAIKEMSNGFYSFIGSNPLTYIQKFELDVEQKNNLTMYIYDIKNYDDRLTYDICCMMTTDEIINILNHN